MKGTDITDSVRVSWAPYLQDGETLLWVGAPEGLPPRLPEEKRELAQGAIFTVVGLLLAAAGMAVALPLILLGIYVAVIKRHRMARRFAEARYALTDRRALISLPGALTQWPLPGGATLVLQEGAPGSVLFDQPRKPPLVRRSYDGSSLYRLRPFYGLEAVADAAALHGLILEQGGARVAPTAPDLRGDRQGSAA